MICSKALVALVMAASRTVAAPLDRNLVVADAVWVAHLDVDTFKRTSVGQHVLAEMDEPEAKNKLTAFQAIFSFDPRKNEKARQATESGRGSNAAGGW